jgi:hypothetical protein
MSSQFTNQQRRGSGMRIQRPKLPGQPFIDETGKQRFLVQTREGWIYDTVVIGDLSTSTTTLADDRQFEFFLNTTTKGKQFTNLDEDKRIPGGWLMTVDKIALYLPHYWGNVRVEEEDMKKVLSNSSPLLKINKVDYKEDIPIFWEGGVGLVGQSGSAAGFYLSIGVPSPQAIPRIKEPFDLSNTKDTHDIIEAWLRFPRTQVVDNASPTPNACPRPIISAYNASVITGGVVAVVMLFHGMIYTAGTKV